MLIIEDLMTTPIETRNAVGLFEIAETREGREAVLIASRPEPDEWRLRIERELMVGSIPNRIATGPRHIDFDGPNTPRTSRCKGGCGATRKVCSRHSWF